MKSKIICLLIVLFCCGLAASPNKKCDGRRTGKTKQVTIAPAKTVVMMIDDVDLLPFHHYLNNF